MLHAAIPVRIALENKQWEKAANLELHNSEVVWEQFPWQKSIHHFGRALGAAHTKNFDAANKEIGILINLRQELINNEEESNANLVAIQIKTSQAWLYFSKGDQEKGISLMQEASIMEDNTQKHGVTPGEVLPTRELYGDMLLAMNKPQEALEAYELNMEGRPNRFNSIYGAAVSANRIGDDEKATRYFEMLIVLTEGTNSNRPEIAEANTFLQENVI